MPNKTELLVVDTNLWISFLISRSFVKLDKVLKRGSARLIFNAELLEEFIEVRNGQSLKRYLLLRTLLICCGTFIAMQILLK